MRVVLTTRFASPRALRARLAIEQALRQSPVNAARATVNRRDEGKGDETAQGTAQRVIILRPAISLWRAIGPYELARQSIGQSATTGEAGDVTLLIGTLAELIEVAMFLETDGWEPVTEPMESAMESAMEQSRESAQ